MKIPFHLFTLAWILAGGMMSAQTISVSPSLLNFGTVTETAPDSQQVTITNNSGYTVTVEGYRFYSFFGHTPFSTSSGNISIPDGGSAGLWIKFSPRHNIFHNSELFILTDSRRGALRVNLLAQGHYSNAYYDPTENTEEEVLKDSLHTLLERNYYNAGYVTARDSMFMSYDNKKLNGQGAAVNTIECVYTGRNAAGYSDRTDCQTNFSFNTEHTFPQGFFNQQEPMRADLFHLFPTDDNANNIRGSLPFGTVSNPTWQQGGSKTNGTTFEPRDFHKGRTARAMLYFVTRYQNYNNFLDSQEGILRQWHVQFPPDSIEILRCQAISLLQNNRNPLVDYPQFTERISSFSNTSAGIQAASTDTPEDTIQFGLVNAANPVSYTFWVANDGNQPLTLSGLSLNPSALLSFLNGTGNNVSIPPGEASAIEIELANPAPGTLLSGSLNFIAQGTGLLANVSIPIRAQMSFTGSAEITNAKGYTLYPNPATDLLCLSGEEPLPADLMITDLSGRVLRRLSGAGKRCVDLDEREAPGFYFLQWNAGGKIFRKAWIKQ
ncbi:MAG: endonuclease [Bacteroidia bacterium]|nr:endonuclease [Bacteroidia bacterium]